MVIFGTSQAYILSQCLMVEPMTSFILVTLVVVLSVSVNSKLTTGINGLTSAYAL